MWRLLVAAAPHEEEEGDADEIHCTSSRLHSLPDMKTSRKGSSMNALKGYSRLIKHASLFVALALGAPFVTNAAETGKTFATPEEAVSALVQATSTQSGVDLRAIFGPGRDLENPDRVQATNEFDTFTGRSQRGRSARSGVRNKMPIEVGTNSWPFPVPIVKKEGRWFFDTEAGKEEILSRASARTSWPCLGSGAPTWMPSGVQAVTATATKCWSLHSGSLAPRGPMQLSLAARSDW